MVKGPKTRFEELLTALAGSPLLAPYVGTSATEQCARHRVLSLPVPFVPGRKEPPGEQADPRLAAVAEALEELDSAGTVAETVDVCCRTIREQFKVARMAVALREESGASYFVAGAGELPPTLGSLPAELASVFLPKGKAKRMVPYDARMREVLPPLQAMRCCCFPLQSQDQLLGFFLVLDCELRKEELMLLSMVAQAAAGRLSRIVKDAEQAQRSARSDRLVTLTNTLLQVDDKDQLYQSILSIACDLVDGQRGTIMLSDPRSQKMEVAFTVGASPDPDESACGKVGKGIAAMVAQNGEPLLVDAPPHFKPKSLICVPLKLKDTVIGVLSVSERKNLAPFANADLQLLTSFTGLASVMIERTAVLEKSMEFEQLSVTDALTGLYNRRFLKSRLEEELNRSTHQSLSLALLFIDLDFFKSYNDVCGHLAGDKALKRVAEIIRGSVREMDIVARYGGEEFCALLPGTNKEEALLVAERIRAEIEAEPFPGNGESAPTGITASLGVASFPEDGRAFTALVHASDVALYEAKALGRNRIAAARSSIAHIHPQPSSRRDSTREDLMPETMQAANLDV